MESWPYLGSSDGADIGRVTCNTSNPICYQYRQTPLRRESIVFITDKNFVSDSNVFVDGRGPVVTRFDSGADISICYANHVPEVKYTGRREHFCDLGRIQRTLGSATTSLMIAGIDFPGIKLNVIGHGAYGSVGLVIGRDIMSDYPTLLLAHGHFGEIHMSTTFRDGRPLQLILDRYRESRDYFDVLLDKKFRLKSEINALTYDSLVDSGAEKSLRVLTPSEARNRIEIPNHLPSNSIRGICDEVINLGTEQSDIVICEQCIPNVEMDLVTDIGEPECLLGCDFLRQTEAAINIPERQLWLKVHQTDRNNVGSNDAVPTQNHPDYVADLSRWEYSPVPDFSKLLGE